MANTSAEKCACTDCTCKVTPETAVTKDGRNYCSEACAGGHASGTGCGHGDCPCGG